MQGLILLPVVALVVLTASVWVALFMTRVGEMRARRIRPQSLATRAQAATALARSAPSDNFMNLFELPVLFYVLALALYATNLVDGLYLGLAWLYVLLRYVHSLIHLTYNRVMHRFYVFAASGIVLWILWGRFAVQLVGRLVADG